MKLATKIRPTLVRVTDPPAPMAMGVRPASSWGDLAYDFGFADQSHLIREFRALAEATPAGYLSASRMSDSFNPILVGGGNVGP